MPGEGYLHRDQRISVRGSCPPSAAANRGLAGGLGNAKSARTVLPTLDIEKIKVETWAALIKKRDEDRARGIERYPVVGPMSKTSGQERFIEVDISSLDGSTLAQFKSSSRKETPTKVWMSMASTAQKLANDPKRPVTPPEWAREIRAIGRYFEQHPQAKVFGPSGPHSCKSFAERMHKRSCHQDLSRVDSLLFADVSGDSTFESDMHRSTRALVLAKSQLDLDAHSEQRRRAQQILDIKREVLMSSGSILNDQSLSDMRAAARDVAQAAKENGAASGLDTYLMNMYWDLTRTPPMSPSLTPPPSPTEADSLIPELTSENRRGRARVRLGEPDSGIRVRAIDAESNKNIFGDISSPDRLLMRDTGYRCLRPEEAPNLSSNNLLISWSSQASTHQTTANCEPADGSLTTHRISAHLGSVLREDTPAPWARKVEDSRARETAEREYQSALDRMGEIECSDPPIASSEAAAGLISQLKAEADTRNFDELMLDVRDPQDWMPRFLSKRQDKAFQRASPRVIDAVDRSILLASKRRYADAIDIGEEFERGAGDADFCDWLTLLPRGLIEDILEARTEDLLENEDMKFVKTYKPGSREVRGEWPGLARPGKVERRVVIRTIGRVE